MNEPAVTPPPGELRGVVEVYTKDGVLKARGEFKAPVTPEQWAQFRGTEEKQP